MRPKAIEGWPNTAGRLAGWRRVNQQGVILSVMDGPLPPALTDHTTCPSYVADILLNVHKKPSHKEGMGW